jgi:hypothetical protein
VGGQVGVMALLSVGDPASRGLSEVDGQEKDWPQPQLRVAFGFWIANPAPWRPSL